MTGGRGAERIATRPEIMAHAGRLRSVLHDHGLTCSDVVGVHVQIITDDIPGAIDAKDTIAL